MSDAHAPSRLPERQQRYDRLRTFNVVIGLTHLAQAILILVISNDFALPVFASVLQDDPVAGQSANPPELLFTVGLGVWIAVFLLFAAADHLLTALPLRGWYERKLDQRANDARWIEYSISSSIMVGLIAMLTGIWDLSGLVGIFAANSAMIIFGLLMERKESPDAPDMSAFWFGTLFGLVPWGLIAYYIIAAGGEVPGFVYVIITVQFLLFFSFALNMWLQYRKVGRWSDYIFGEYVYVILSLAAKTLLAWLVFGNVLRS